MLRISGSFNGLCVIFSGKYKIEHVVVACLAGHIQTRRDDLQPKKFWNAKKAPNVSLGETVKARLKQFSVMNKLKKKALRSDCSALFKKSDYRYAFATGGIGLVAAFAGPPPSPDHARRTVAFADRAFAWSPPLHWCEGMRKRRV
ncbi:hypothetical protein Dimus_011403 [Dionaea muscipula]